MKKPTPEDARIIEAVVHSAKRVSYSVLDPSEVAQRIRQRPETVQSLQELGETSDKFILDMARRYVLLRRIASRQSTSITHGGRKVLDGTDLLLDKKIEILQNSFTLGRQFGKLGGNDVETGTSSDENFLKNVLIAPNDYLAYREEIGLRYTLKAEDYFRENYSSEHGCPAMGVSMPLQDGSTNLYDAFWQYYAGLYIDEYAAGREINIAKPPYTKG